MMDEALVTALALVAVFAALVVPLVLLLHGRQKFLRTMGVQSADGLAAMTAHLFDAPPTSRAANATSVVTGRRAGEVIEIRANYIQTYSYALMTITTGLRGAQPKLKVVIKEHFLDIDDVEGVIDAETKAEIRAYADRVQGLKRVDVSPRGLVLTLTGTPHEPDRDKGKRIEETMALAAILRKRILDTLERKALSGTRVRVDAYREPAELEDEPAAPKSLRRRSA